MAREGPMKIPGILYSPLVKKKNRQYFIISPYLFCSFRNFPPLVLDTVMSPGPHTSRNPINIYKKTPENI